MRVEIFVQARMGSSRLPGKVMRPVLNKPLLGYLIERLREVDQANHIVVLTTEQSIDDEIIVYCQSQNIPTFRGSEENVLERYYRAAVQRNRPDVLVRITADCPLIDPEVVNSAIETFLESKSSCDYLSNSLERTFPRGLDVEVFSFEALEQAFQQAQKPEEKEHVTVFIYRHPELFRLKNMMHSPSLAQHRWTVDTPEDFELVRLILENLYPKNPHFRLNDILYVLERHPEWTLINAHIEQKKLSP